MRNALFFDNGYSLDPLFWSLVLRQAIFFLLLHNIASELLLRTKELFESRLPFHGIPYYSIEITNKSIGGCVSIQKDNILRVVFNKKSQLIGP